MFLNHKASGRMVEIVGIDELFDLHKPAVRGRFHFGEEVQDLESFRKSELVFLSGEELPRCWTDSHYRDGELRR